MKRRSEEHGGQNAYGTEVATSRADTFGLSCGLLSAVQLVSWVGN